MVARARKETVSIPEKQRTKNVGRFKTFKPTPRDILLSAWPHLLKFPQLSQIVSRGEDMLKHISLWETFHIQTPTEDNPKTASIG